MSDSYGRSNGQGRETGGRYEPRQAIENVRAGGGEQAKQEQREGQELKNYVAGE
ncbi:MAG: hypothetical protein ABSG65_09655 [Bryobacteraceae bacterium]|jgi:hypothetical protein